MDMQESHTHSPPVRGASQYALAACNLACDMRGCAGKVQLSLDRGCAGRVWRARAGGPYDEKLSRCCALGRAGRL